jgi:hypothetical protein
MPSPAASLERYSLASWYVLPLVNDNGKSKLQTFVLTSRKGVEYREHNPIHTVSIEAGPASGRPTRIARLRPRLLESGMCLPR